MNTIQRMAYYMSLILFILIPYTILIRNGSEKDKANVFKSVIPGFTFVLGFWFGFIVTRIKSLFINKED